MSVSLKGDQPFENVPSVKAKALRINLNEHIYGTFAEIGAGQEVARHFFRSGGASGTIAKTMSAYDKAFSDAIYGHETDSGYVSESRLKKMLDHETKLLEDRMDRKVHPNKMFFTYANTVATIDFAKKYKGHGWMGLKFQTTPKESFSEVHIHVRFHSFDAKAQQESLGLMGLNLIYGAYYKHDQPKKLLKYLYDHIDPAAIEIDTINFSGPLFSKVDNRVMSLELVKNGMTEAVMFGPDGNNILPARVLWKKNILAIRGSFRPVTLVNEDMYLKSKEIILKDKNLNEKNLINLFEITLSNLRSTNGDGDGDVNEKDFMDRAKLLCALGYTVMITNFKEYYKLAEYFSNYTQNQVVLTMGVNNLIEIFDEKYYDNLRGGILEAFGKLFVKNLRVFLYPMRTKEGLIINSNNIHVANKMKNLYKYFKSNKILIDIKKYNENLLKIYSFKVLKKIRNKKSGWEKMLPEEVTNQIKSKKLFGYK
ncbi:MAG: nicotinate-nucleotide adenylyltransferase [Flavobacteriaceae bacterium]|nr:nicotinate-nucleotide adenylyltransferase [Flavobacteriaceae bacterium]|tara:strand:- start:3643 stop:5085 length:1443 start_codon:yes stop_codon:yes gene_type:complete